MSLTVTLRKTYAERFTDGDNTAKRDALIEEFLQELQTYLTPEMCDLLDPEIASSVFIEWARRLSTMTLSERLGAMSAGISITPFTFYYHKEKPVSDNVVKLK